MGQKTSKAQPKNGKEQSVNQNEFAIYILPNNEEATLAQIRAEVVGFGSNAVLLSRDPHSSSGSSSTQKYNTYYIMGGHWVSELDKDGNIINERKTKSIDFNLRNAKLTKLKHYKDIQLLLPTTPKYQNILNTALGYGGIRSSQSQFEQLTNVLHEQVIAPDLDIKSVVAVKRTSRKLYGLYKPEDLKRTIKKLSEHAILATPYDIWQIKKILDSPLSGKPPNLRYLRELLCTPFTVTDNRGRVHQNRVLAQIFLGMNSVNVNSERGNRVIDGLSEWLRDNYYKRLDDGEALWAQHYYGQLPEGYEKVEAERVANGSQALNRMIGAVTANEALCQQTMSLDSFHGYDLRDIAWTQGDENKVLAAAIYLEAGAEELACSFRALNGQVTTKLLAWDSLANFPRDVKKMIDPSYELCPMPDANKALEKEKLYVSYDRNTQVLHCTALNLVGARIEGQIQLSDLMKRLEENDWPRLQEALENLDLDQLKAFLPAILAISSERNLTLSKQTYLPMLLARLAEPGVFYTQEQIQQLKQLSDVTIKATSETFDETWNQLQQHIRSITAVETKSLTLLRELYAFRNYFEPNGVYTTGYYSTLPVLKEFFELYKKNYGAIDNDANALLPKNLFCIQKLAGSLEAGLTAEELQLFAQGPYAVLSSGDKLKRLFSYTYGGGSIYPFSDPSLSVLWNCFGAGMAARLARGGVLARGLDFLCRARTSAQQDLCRDLAINQIRSVR